MSLFSQVVTKLLNDYKTIIKKHLTKKEWDEKVYQLGLRRKMLRPNNNNDDTALYLKASRVIEDITDWINSYSNPPSWHSGLEEFGQHFKNILNDYQIENGEVIHTSQKASGAMVQAIQLMKLPKSGESAHKLDICGQLIARYGTKDQKEAFTKALKNYQQSDINFFLPLLINFERHLQDFTSLFAEQQVNLG